ncbi:hypothetical protein PAXRUDRAFT_174362 [Paxillus rubicundulus Ve08.2h10]|uniref:Uncharacterized protein n=1 Tax=Paxillus rubicundulus Ve08.2h10 TaxID=930991 RepID=A0A0D0DC97_9AGAM|nr:hypothetical protein PAXRUDRAFT_174362 [Paxillus rubicundulus Ve08.2h10]
MLGQLPSQLSDAEKTLMLSVNALQKCNCVFGEPLSLDEILDPAKEQDIDNSESSTKLAADEAIAAPVCQEMAVAHGEVIEVGSDNDDDNEDSGSTLTHQSTLELCQQLKSVCLVFGDAGSSLKLLRNSRYFELTYDRRNYLMLNRHLLIHILLINFMTTHCTALYDNVFMSHFWQGSQFCHTVSHCHVVYFWYCIKFEVVPLHTV